MTYDTVGEEDKARGMEASRKCQEHNVLQDREFAWKFAIALEKRPVNQRRLTLLWPADGAKERRRD
jgi:hypothetical protein